MEDFGSRIFPLNYPEASYYYLCECKKSTYLLADNYYIQHTEIDLYHLYKVDFTHPKAGHIFTEWYSYHIHLSQKTVFRINNLTFINIMDFNTSQVLIIISKNRQINRAVRNVKSLYCQILLILILSNLWDELNPAEFFYGTGYQNRAHLTIYVLR